MKRSLSILLPILLLFSLLPISALAEGGGRPGSGDSTAIQSGTLQMRYNGSEWGTVYQLAAGTPMVELRLLQGTNMGETVCDYWLTDADKDHITVGGAVISATYTLKTITPENGQAVTISLWTLTIEGEVGSTGYVQYGESESNRVTITVAESRPPQGGGEQPSESDMPNGDDVRKAQLLCIGEGNSGANTYTRCRDSMSLLPNNIFVVQEGKASVPANDFFTAEDTYYVLDTSNNANWTSVGNLHYINIVDNGEPIRGITWDLLDGYWESISEPQDYLMMIKQDGTWYKLFVKVSPKNEPQGPQEPTDDDAVDDADRIIDPTDPPLVTPFEWNGRTYYLSLAGRADKDENLVPVGGRGRTVSDGSGPWLLSARVFDCISGTPNQNGAVYQNNYTVYQEMDTAGWKFIIELHPTDVGCEYYPVQEHKGDWYKYYINEYSVGRWIFETKIVKLGEDGNITETLATNCCRHFYQYSKTINVDLDGDNVDSFNAQISAAVNDTATKYHLGEEVNALKLRVYRLHFRLPAGNFEGQLVLPFFSDHISLTGAVNKNESGEDVLLTTIRGGVRVDTHTCNIENIRFIGATDESGQRVDNESNCAIYGGGQGVYKNCVFEDFYYALHGKDRIAWGGMGSTFQNNHIAIYIEKALQGGNLDMVDNWFIGNDIAIQVDAFGPDLPVSLLTMRYDRFINNGVDMVNNSGVILWMSRNYFYRGERVNGTWPAYKGSNSNYIAYMPYLPVMGGKTPTFAYPLARNTECTDYFYPVWYAPAFWEQHQHPSWWAHYCPQWWGMDHYPSFVREGDRMPEGELTDTHVGFFDGERVVGSFDFGSSQEGE